MSRIQNIEDSGDPARAQVIQTRTVNLVPKYQPPPSTRVGHLHAAGAIPPRPVGEIPIDTSPNTSIRPSPLRSIGLPTHIVAPELVVTRTLDCGRLRCDDLMTHAGWESGIELEADLSVAGRIRLRPKADVASEPLSHRRHPHVLDDKRMLLPSGLRTFLGIGEAFQRVKTQEH